MKSQNPMKNSERCSLGKDFVPLICYSEDGHYLSELGNSGHDASYLAPEYGCVVICMINHISLPRLTFE